MQGCLISAFIYFLVIDSSSPWRGGGGGVGEGRYCTTYLVTIPG